MIDLKPDTPETLDSKTYPLSVGQQEALDEFLKEHLKKGYIHISKLPYTAPFFFIKKKDGKLRPVQDYHKLSKYTVKNKYPIPLIKELINQLVGKYWFTKFDIQWGFPRTTGTDYPRRAPVFTCQLPNSLSLSLTPNWPPPLQIPMQD